MRSTILPLKGRGFFVNEDKMSIMGIDLGLKTTGICIIGDIFFNDPNILYYADCIKYNGKLEYKERIERIIKISNSIIKRIYENKIGYVFVENYAYGAPFRMSLMGELGGKVCCDIYATYGILPVMVPVMEARKVVLGKGYREKKDVRRVLKKLKGFDIDDDNIVDACIIALYGLQKIKKDVNE